MSNDDTKLSDELRAIEQSLRGLAPSDTRVNRDRLMYESGWAACEAEMVRPAPRGPSVIVERADKTREQHRWLWPATSAALLFISASLAAVLITREPQRQIVYMYSSAQPSDNAAAKKAAAPGQVRIASEIARSRSDAPWLGVFQSFRMKTAPVDSNYLKLRSRVLAFGVDVLPSSAVSRGASDSPPGASRYGEMRGALLGG